MIYRFTIHYVQQKTIPWPLHANIVKSLLCQTLRATDQPGDGVYQLPIFFFRFLKLGDSISGSWIAQKPSWLSNKEPISVRMDVLCQLLMFSPTALQVVSFLSACGTYLFIYWLRKWRKMNLVSWLTLTDDTGLSYQAVGGSQKSFSLVFFFFLFLSPAPQYIFHHLVVVQSNFI